MAKTIKQKQKAYIEKYAGIPTDYNERLDWMTDQYKLTANDMDAILYERSRRMMSLYMNSIQIVLYQIPEGAKRPRYRMINRSNVLPAAMANPDFIHVYSPGAAANHDYMKKLVTQQEIVQLEHLICTPCDVQFKAYFPTPKSYNKIEVFMAEIGLNREIVKPDWDNIGKLYSDMYNSNIWIDDALTIKGTVEKYYSILPRVEINLLYMNAVYCKQQYENIVKRKDYDESMGLIYI